MVKIKTRHISIVVTVIVAVTMMFSIAVLETAAANRTENREQMFKERSGVKPYIPGTKIKTAFTDFYDKDYNSDDDYIRRVSTNFYSFVLTENMDISVHILSNSNAKYELLGLDRGIDTVHPDKYNAITGTGVGDYFYNNVYGLCGVSIDTSLKKAEGDIQYFHMIPGTYYFCVYGERGANVEFTIATKKLAPPIEFKSGIAVPNVGKRSDHGDNSEAAFISWDKIATARYAVYSIYRDSNTGKFSDWKVTVTDDLDYEIGAGTPIELATVWAKNNDYKWHKRTYYVTVLPFTDTPTRRYGSFSPYVIFDTTERDE